MVDHDEFILVFVDTPLAECERRDVKGLYAQARKGLIKNLTGIDDPYERPRQPDLVIDTVRHSVSDNVLTIVRELMQRGFFRDDPPEPGLVMENGNSQTRALSLPVVSTLTPSDRNP
jgi:adenylylsulfate kinase-like enzyme